MTTTETNPLEQLPVEIAALSRTEAMADLITARQMRDAFCVITDRGLAVHAEWGYAAFLLSARLARRD